MYPIEEMTDAEVKQRLIEEYARADDGYAIAVLKEELYDRGYDWSDVVEIAIAALLRRIQIGNTYSLN